MQTAITVPQQARRTAITFFFLISARFLIIIFSAGREHFLPDGRDGFAVLVEQHEIQPDHVALELPAQPLDVGDIPAPADVGWFRQIHVSGSAQRVR